MQQEWRFFFSFLELNYIAETNEKTSAELQANSVLRIQAYISDYLPFKNKTFEYLSLNRLPGSFLLQEIPPLPPER